MYISENETNVLLKNERGNNLEAIGEKRTASGEQWTGKSYNTPIDYIFFWITLACQQRQGFNGLRDYTESGYIINVICAIPIIRDSDKKIIVHAKGKKESQRTQRKKI